MSDESEKPRRMLSLEQVQAIVPISRMTLFRMERDGRFPASHAISLKRRMRYEDEVLAWQRQLPENTGIQRTKRAQGSH